MRLAVVAAGFTPGEADQLRRAMAAWRRPGLIDQFRKKLLDGMRANHLPEEFAQRVYQQIEGFGEYGFPESHAASFALLVYVSAWLKCRYPAVFACALLNSQPMGFYAPAQIVRDAIEHGVEVRPVDVNHSHWDCTLEPGKAGEMALRLGFRQIKGVRQDEAERLLAARGPGYGEVRQLWRRAGLARDSLERLARADAFRSAGLDRRRALWALKGLGEAPLPLFAFAEAQPFSSLPRTRESSGAMDSRVRGNDAEAVGRRGDEDEEPEVALPEMPLGQHVIEDYRALRLSLKAHPLRFLRPALEARGVTQSRHLAGLPAGRRLTVAGLVLVRQRPGTAKGVIFVTLEDEAAIANVIVRLPIFERYRRVVLGSRLLLARGRLEREGIVIHLLAEHLEDLSGLLDGLSELGPMEPPYARADVVKHPMGDPRTALPKGRSFR